MTHELEERARRDNVAHEAFRDRLGARVREVWIAWAEQQPNPKPSWLVPYEELSEADKEADRCIGAVLWADGFAARERVAVATASLLGGGVT